MKMSRTLSLLTLLALQVSTSAHAANKSSSAKLNSQSKGKPAAAATPATTPAPVMVKTAEYAVKAEDSVFAIVTHKAGLAAKLAHNHLVVARGYDAKLIADPNQLNSGSFEFKAKVAEFEVDRPDLQKRWYPMVQSLGWLNEPFTNLKDSDREKIRENMLSEEQMDVEKYPTISAQILKITDATSKVGERSYNKKASVAVTLHGKTVTRDFSANIKLQGDELLVDAVTDFKFSEFSIVPYKALLGALGNDDTFNMLVSLRAVRK
ncbi:YceI family protein [bacterium]|nr:YceI family protein [bacterium]